MNNRNNTGHQRKIFEGMYNTNPNPFPHSSVPVSNPPAYLLGPRTPRHYVNQSPHSDMKNNHMPNMTHGPIQMVPAHISQRQPTLPHIRPNTPRNIPRGSFQYQVYLPSNVTYQGSSNFYSYPQQQTSPAPTVIMPFLQPNYSTNQAMYYSTTAPRSLQMTNIPQGQQNPTVANMSNAQNSHGQSIIVQSQPMEMTANSQPLQVPQQPTTTPMPDTRHMKRKNQAIKIINPDTGNEVVVNNTPQAPPSADELEKMKVQSLFQSQVQSVVKKDDTKASDNNQNNEGGDKVRNEFQSQVKKLIGEKSIPSEAIIVDKPQLAEENISKPEEINVNTTSIEEEPIEKIDSTSTIEIPINTLEKVDIIDSPKETPAILLPSSTFTHEIQSQNINVCININQNVINLDESNSVKKIPDEESLKPVKSKKSKGKKKKTLVKDNDETIINVQPSIIESVETSTNTQDIKTQNNDSKKEEDECVIQKQPEDILQQPQEIQNNGIQQEIVKEVAPEATSPKLPSYIEKLPYAEGQWSVTNPTGKKVYSRQFLIQLGNESVCQKKPEILADWYHITKSNISQHSSLGGIPNLPRSQSASATGFMPAYFKVGNSSRGMAVMQPGAKRNSSQGKTASKTAKPNTIHMSLSLREEVKLNQTENAFVPTAIKKAIKPDKNKNEDELKTEDVNKNVRSILNKITPENKIKLTDQFKSLPIDTIERLEKTIDLVFEKAIEEQSFAPLYASLCAAMQSVQVNSINSEKMTFKKLIISKCQSLFELDKAQEMDSAKKLAEINSCKDPDKKKDLQLEFEENERRLRKRSVGNCRFIGELFKEKILTPNIMLYCIVNLVTKHVEEPLECLCNLLKTVGKELEQSCTLNDTFEKLKYLTSKEMRNKIPSRIRFMIQDVIDLRRDKWVPRRLDSKPKLINEIENDAKNEAMEQSMALSSFRPEKQQREHHREEKYRGGDNKNRRGNDNEWNVVQNPKYKQQNYTIDQSKLQGFKDSSSVTTLGPSSKWSFSNSSGTKNSTFTSSNTFAPLNDDKKLSTSQMLSNKNAPRKLHISESEERQRMMAGVNSIMPHALTQTLNSLSTPKETVKDPELELDPEVSDKIISQCKNIIHEYEQMHNLDDIIYSLVEDDKSTIRTRHDEFVKTMSIITLDSTPNSRTEAGKLFAELLSTKNSKNNEPVISVSVITHGIDAVLKDWNEYLMDYPQFFSYIAAIVAPLLISKSAKFGFKHLKDACTSLHPEKSSVFFIEVLHKILSSKETQNIKEDLGGILWIYNKWRASEYIPLDTFMSSNDINKHFTNDRVGVFLLSVAMYDKMKQTDNKLLYDIMHTWISKNISAEIIKCPQFVRALAIAIVILCLKPNNSYEDFFDHVHGKLLTCYIRSKPLPEPEIQAREVQCLYGIQLMSATLEHPGGMVLKLFHKLYQDSVISKESFELWKKEDGFKMGFDEDLETKTMAVVVLNSFFLSLSTNDSDDDDTADQ